MPFLGKDWRSSGEQWIRTEHGWERTRVLECILDNLNIGLSEEKRRRHRRRNKKTSSSSSTTSSTKGNKRLDSVSNDDEEMTDDMEETFLSTLYDEERMMNRIDEDEEDEDEEDDDEEDDEGWKYVYDDELSLLSDDEEEEDEDEEEEDVASSSSTSSSSPSGVFRQHMRASRRRRGRGSQTQQSSLAVVVKRQPHIIYSEVDAVNRENNAPKATISEVLNALDMPGAVKDIKRFNYVCRLVQIIINEKLNQLSGNAQRTLFMIVKHMLIQVIRTQENLNVMRKLLHDFKKKIQDSIYFYFYYIGSQKLCDRHLATIAKWQEILESPSHHRKLKRLNTLETTSPLDNKENTTNSSEGAAMTTTTFDRIPVDCQLEIMRRLNCGLDLVNVSKCNRNLNSLISSELKIWKNLCQFHFQQTTINSFVTRLQKKPTAGSESESPSSSSPSSLTQNSSDPENDLDWKLIYFRLKRRYGHREIYTDMIHKCYHCKSLFWKEIGHPCVIKESLTYPDSLEIRSEPITPKKLIELLLK